MKSYEIRIHEKELMHKTLLLIIISKYTQKHQNIMQFFHKINKQYCAAVPFTKLISLSIILDF